jgi:hypothetical protein
MLDQYIARLRNASLFGDNTFERPAIAVRTQALAQEEGLPPLRIVVGDKDMNVDVALNLLQRKQQPLQPARTPKARDRDGYINHVRVSTSGP